MAIFEPKQWVNPLDKCQFFDFLNLLFLQPRNAFFRSRITKDTFFWLILAKKKVVKMDIFGPKPWEKCQFFHFLNFLIYSPEMRFSV